MDDISFDGKSVGGRERFITVRIGDGMCVEGLRRFVNNASNGTTESGWHWDGHCLFIETGSSESKPLFVRFDTKSISVAFSLIDVTQGAPVRVDPVAWTVFQYLGTYVGRDTPFENTLLLGPYTSAQWRNGKLSISPTTASYERLQISESVARHEFRRLVSQSLARNAPDSPMLAELSSGLDSRHLLWEALRRGKQISRCITSQKYPPDDLDERPGARKTADKAGICWEYLRPPRNRARAESRAASLQGFCSDEGAWCLYRAGVSEFAHWLNGMGGDALTGRFPTIPDPREIDSALDRGDLYGGAAFLLNNRRSMALGFLAQRWVLPLCTKREAIERVAIELESHSKSADQLASFIYGNRVLRKLLPGARLLVNPQQVVVAPFVDDELAHFMLSLGPRRRYPPGFHARAIRGDSDGAGVRADLAKREPGYVVTSLAHVVAYYWQLNRLLTELGFHVKAILPSLTELAELRSPRLMVHLLTQTLHLALMGFTTVRTDSGRAAPLVPPAENSERGRV